MHISEGILPLTWAAANTAAALPFVLAGARGIKRQAEAQPEVKPLMGLMGAAVFVISALPIPVPIAGTCSHPTGVGMAAIFLKPLPAAAVTGVVLLFQALLMAHGGLTTWGANVFNMGVLGSFAGYGAFIALRRLRLPLWAGAAAAGALGDLVTYASTALTLALALHGDQSVWAVWLAVFGAFLPAQLPLAVLEAVVTSGMVSFVATRRPDIAARVGLGSLMARKEATGVA